MHIVLQFRSESVHLSTAGQPGRSAAAAARVHAVFQEASCWVLLHCSPQLVRRQAPCREADQPLLHLYLKAYVSAELLPAMPSWVAAPCWHSSHWSGVLRAVSASRITAKRICCVRRGERQGQHVSPAHVAALDLHCAPSCAFKPVRPYLAALQCVLAEKSDAWLAIRPTCRFCTLHAAGSSAGVPGG